MTSPTGERAGIVRRYQHAVLVQSADELADLYAEDAVHELPFLFPGLRARLEGRAEVRATYQRAWQASEARPTSVREVAIHFVDDGQTVVVEQMVEGTLASSGGSFAFPGVLVLRVRNGEITHVRDYMDGLAVARALGRLPDIVAALGPP